jgi:hypothetical protein
VERIRTPEDVWLTPEVNRIRYPPGSISGYYFDFGTFFFSQTLEEAVEYHSAVALGHPYNGIGVMVYNSGDIAMALGVGSLIDADAHQVMKAAAMIRFKFVNDSCDTSAYRPPGDPHELTYRGFTHGSGEPGNCSVKVFGKSRVRKCPGHIHRDDTVFLTGATGSVSFQLDQDSSEIQCPPCAQMFRSVITRDTSSALTAPALLCGGGAYSNDQFQYSTRQFFKTVSLNDNVLDAKQFLQ